MTTYYHYGTRARRLVQIYAMLVILTIGSNAIAAADDSIPLPSEVIPKMLSALVNDTPRQQLSELFLQEIQTTNLSNHEKYHFGEAWLIAGVPLEAADAFTEALNDGTSFARFAESRLIMISLNAEDDVTSALEDMQAFRGRYAPSSDDLWGLFHTVNGLARRYKEDGRHDKVIEAIIAELNWLDVTLPHPSFHLPAMHLDSFMVEGQLSKIEEILRNVQSRQSSLQGHKSQGDLIRCLRLDDIIILQDQSYTIGDEIRCDTGFRRDNLLKVIHDTLERIENLRNESSNSNAGTPDTTS